MACFSYARYQPFARSSSRGSLQQKLDDAMTCGMRGESYRAHGLLPLAGALGWLRGVFRHRHARAAQRRRERSNKRVGREAAHETLALSKMRFLSRGVAYAPPSYAIAEIINSRLTASWPRSGGSGIKRGQPAASARPASARQSKAPRHARLGIEKMPPLPLHFYRGRRLRSLRQRVGVAARPMAIRR